MHLIKIDNKIYKSEYQSKCFDNMMIENIDYLQALCYLTANTPMFYLIFVIRIRTDVYFLKHLIIWV